MLAADRQARILELTRRQGSVQVDELARELNVSPMTIRRDLVKLKESDQIERCHGGAVAKLEMAYEDKLTSHKKEKEKIAEVCASFVEAGDTVFLDAGTTTYEIAGLIKDIPGIMAVTNDLEIARLLKDSSAELALCGGMMQKSTGSMWGYYATQMLLDFRFDAGFFGCASINEHYEVMTPTIEKAFLKRESAKRCEKAYLAVDDSKFGRQAMTKINHLSDYTAVVTNQTFTKEETVKLKRMGVQLKQV